MSDTATRKTDAPVTIDNPEQASSNFYWLYHTTGGAFNLQTTIRGILSPAQLEAHIKSVLELTAHIIQIGGLAKQVGKSAYESAGETLPDMSIETTATPVPSNEPEYVPVEESAPSKPEVEELTFTSEKLLCTKSKDKMYYKIAGGPYPKYGVVVWPEVLTAAGVNTGKLEPKEYKFPGYKVFYIKNDKGDPKKVTRLEKVS